MQLLAITRNFCKIKEYEIYDFFYPYVLQVDNRILSRLLWDH